MSALYVVVRESDGAPAGASVSGFWSALDDAHRSGNICSTTLRHLQGNLQHEGDECDGYAFAKRALAEPVTDAQQAVSAERARQMSKGFDAAHDDQHVHGEIILGAVAKALVAHNRRGHGKSYWPWPEPFSDIDPFNGSSRALLIEAAAMICAEVERLDRDALTPTASTEGAR